MCDEITEAENEVYLARKKLNRRDAGKGTGAALAVVLTGCDSRPGPAKQAPSAPAQNPPASAAPKPPAPAAVAPKDTAVPETTSRSVTIKTPEGVCEGFFVAPKGGSYPGVLMWPDIAGLREAFEKMATRLAREGYAVLVVNPYYRSSKLPILTKFSEWRTDEGRAKIGPMKSVLTPEGIAKDGGAYVAWLDQQPEVETESKIATAGYCMSGPYTFFTATASPDRIGVVASFHGGGLVTDGVMSPHKLFGKLKAAALICIAQSDDNRAPGDKEALREAAGRADRTADIEVYPAQHGWCVIDSPVYDEKEAERAWAKMLATFARYL